MTDSGFQYVGYPPVPKTNADIFANEAQEHLAKQVREYEEAERAQEHRKKAREECRKVLRMQIAREMVLHVLRDARWSHFGAKDCVEVAYRIADELIKQNED